MYEIRSGIRLVALAQVISNPAHAPDDRMHRIRKTLVSGHQSVTNPKQPV
ncbi:hypothetical protein [Thermomonas sp.]|nr:hypothetical protein [Thermomonas sp.]MCO5055459.1 hypothetical protein [Thermomonas sp.]